MRGLIQYKLLFLRVSMTLTPAKIIWCRW